MLSSDSTAESFLNQYPGISEDLKQRGNTTIEGVQGLNLRKAIEYLQNQHQYELLLIENGPSTAAPCFSETHDMQTRQAPSIDFTCDGNPIDTLYLAIFEGKLPA